MEELKQLRSKPLSDIEILDLVDHKANLITYDQIKDYKDLDSLLGKHEACIVLYITKILPEDNSVFGHWCCVFKAPWRDNTYCFFDPYGKIPDYTLKFMSPQARQEYGDEPILSQMLLDKADQGNLIVYNNAPLQHHIVGDAICGRLAGLRLQFRHIDGFQFADLMNTYSKQGIISDDIATIMTSFID